MVEYKDLWLLVIGLRAAETTSSAARVIGF